MKKVLYSILALAIAAALYFWFQSHQNLPTNLTSDTATASLTDVLSWHDYNAPDGHFKVSLPSLPHHAQENRTDPETKENRDYEIYVSQKDNGTVYSISAISFNDKKNSELNDDFLQNVTTGLLTSNPTNIVKSTKLIQFGKGKSYDFQLENGDAVIYGKAFFDNKTLYVLTATAKSSAFNPQEFDYFVQSFQLLPPATQK